MTAEKDPAAESLRRKVLERCDRAVETNRAEIDLIALSFQSQVKRERHVWISMRMESPKDGFSVDLEDWTYEGTWDNAVATIDTESESTACCITCLWLSGAPLDLVLEHCGDSTVTLK